MRHRIAGCFIALVMLASPALAETSQVVGAGSLTDAFTDLIRRFPAGADTIATPEFGPSGLMREKIELGMNADLFASADMEQARRLAAGRPERSVIHFTRNRLCAIARSAVGLTPANMLDRLLDPSVRLATSTQGRTPAETMPGQYSPVPSPSELAPALRWRQRPSGFTAAGRGPRCSSPAKAPLRAFFWQAGPM